ncbi:MAG: amidohydrolase family protein [archaeon GB-1867-005]|nr:amidohydrolase family protein [Candidatus Culexmicrobium cathedralense]
MVVIDAHTFIGESIYFRRKKFTSEDLLNIMDKNGVDMAVVVAPPPGPYYDNGNKYVYEATRKHDRLIGVYRLNPWFGDSELEKAKKAISEWGFKALYIDPQNESFSITSPVVKPVIDLAEKLDVPLYIKSAQSRFYSPEGVVFLAYMNPNVKFITGKSSIAAMLLNRSPMAQNLQNLFLETFPLKGGHQGVDRFLKHMPETMDPNRLIFSTQTPFGHVELELKTIEFTGLDESYKRLIMGENVKKLLKI